MSLLFYDGFERYVKADASKFWDYASFAGASLIGAYGRRGGGGARGLYQSGNTIDMYKTITTPTGGGIYSIVGLAFKWQRESTGEFMGFYTSYAPNAAVGLGVNSGGQLIVTATNSLSSGTKYTHSEPLTANTWYYVEVKTTIDNSSGRIIVNLNEVEVLNWTGDNLPYTGNSSIQKITFRCETWFGIYFDDIYIADDQGTGVTDFLGDIRIDAVGPNGAGNYTDFTPSAGANFECVDDNPYDGANYVSDLIVGDKDSYAYVDVPTDLDDASIYGVELINVSKRSAESDNVKMKGFLRTGSTDYEETTAKSLDESFDGKRLLWELDPSDAGAWTQAKINACEFGMEVN